MAEVAPGFPKVKGETRPWECRKADASCTRTKPCASCRGARNRRSGMRKQREARKALEAVTGVPSGRYSSQTGNEENWRQAARVEVKSGTQCKGLATAFLKAEAQSEAARAIGDARPFMKIDMPKDWGGDGIVSCRLSELGRVVEALVNL